MFYNLKKTPKYKDDEIVYFTAVWKLPYKETKEIIPKLARAKYYFYNSDFKSPTPIDKKPSNKPDNKKE